MISFIVIRNSNIFLPRILNYMTMQNLLEVIIIVIWKLLVNQRKRGDIKLKLNKDQNQS